MLQKKTMQAELHSRMTHQNLLLSHGLFTLSRCLWWIAPFSMQNNRRIIIIHITHKTVIEGSERRFSDLQKGSNSFSPTTFCHHRAPNSITSASQHSWQWHGSLDQGLSDSWERVISCPHWYLLQETHADEEGKTSRPRHCLCRQACLPGFWWKVYFMVLRMVSTPSPSGICNFKKTEMCLLLQLVSEKSQEPPGAIQSI